MAYLRRGREPHRRLPPEESCKLSLGSDSFLCFPMGAERMVGSSVLSKPALEMHSQLEIVRKSSPSSGLAAPSGRMALVVDINGAVGGQPPEG